METEHNFSKSMGKIRDDAPGILVCVGKLKDLQKQNKLVQANVEKRSQEVELKEKVLQRSSLDFEERVKRFEAEKAEFGDLKKLVEECSDELRSKRNELSAKLDTSMRIQRDIELRNKRLGEVTAELKKRWDEARDVKVRQRQMEEEIDGQKNELGRIVSEVEESNKKLEEISQEMELKKGEFFEVEKSEAELNGLKKEIEEKRKELGLVKSQVRSWERKFIQVKTLVNVSTVELSSRNDQGEAKLKVKQFGEAKTVLVKHNGVEEEKLVHHPPVIYTYQRRE